jgi:hypothetical protein
MHDEVGNGVSTGPSFGHDDPVLQKRSNQTSSHSALCYKLLMMRSQIFKVLGGLSFFR